MNRYAVAIAGCGPAGLAAALLLHRSGHDVTLFDRFETPQPLGSGLMIQPTGMAVLDALGLASPLVARGARVRALKGINERGGLALDARYDDLGRPGLFGLGVHRASLCDVLHEAVLAAGIRMIGGAEIAATQGGHLRFADGRASERFDLVVDALGVRSPLSEHPHETLAFGALWATLGWPEGGPFDDGLLEQRYVRAYRMVGVLPTGRQSAGAPRQAAFFWSLRADEHARWQSGGLAAWKADIRAMWPETEVLLNQIVDPDQLVFARYCHRIVPQPSAARFYRIGDAWHAASPQLGQGANMALLDAWALAQGLAQGSTVAEGLRLAAGWRAGHVRLYQWLTAAFTPMYQSSAALPPAIRDRLLAPLSRIWPGPRVQASMVTGLFGVPLAELGLAVPNYDALG